MKKLLFFISMILVGFSAFQCSEEDIQAKLPAACETNDCPDTHPTPSPKPSSNDVVAWLNDYYFRKKQRASCQPFIGLVRRQSRGWSYNCNTVHGVLKGVVSIGRVHYYQLDLYFYVRPENPCGKPSGNPSYAGSMYISKSNQKPRYARGYYLGRKPLQWILDPQGRLVAGWNAYYFYKDQATANQVGFFDGVAAQYGGCYTF